MKCLKCYEESDTPYHPKCAERFFGNKSVPYLDCSLFDIEKIAMKIEKNNITIPGVQPKLSLQFTEEKSGKLTLIELGGNHILKPPSEIYKDLPQNEDVTMLMAESCGIKTVPHILIKLKSGELAYLTKRIDRKSRMKIHMEDMCQILGNLTESKYRSSMEKIGKAILAHSATPGLDIVSYFEIALFCYLVGNSDMHLKNFSLIESQSGFVLAPAYDLVSVHIALPEDLEELALPLNGKKNKISLTDFKLLGESLGLSQKVITNVFSALSTKKDIFEDLIHKSFLDEKLKMNYCELVTQRFKIFEGKQAGG